MMNAPTQYFYSFLALVVSGQFIKFIRLVMTSYKFMIYNFFQSRGQQSSSGGGSSVVALVALVATHRSSKISNSTLGIALAEHFYLAGGIQSAVRGRGQLGANASRLKGGCNHIAQQVEKFTAI